MIPVIVASHTEGVVRVWYRQPDGTLTQTGRFVVGPTIEPPELAVLVADLADTLHWGNGATPVKPAPPALTRAKPKVKAKPKDDSRTRSRASRAVIQQRRNDALAWLATNGPATAAEAAAALFPADLPDKNGKARKTLEQLVDGGLVARLRAAPGDPMRFKALKGDDR